MSGGSYNYVSMRMDAGDLSDLDQYIAQAKEDMDDAINGPADKNDSELTRMAMLALRNDIECLGQEMEAVRKRTRALADLFHELEWWRSGDSCVVDVKRYADKWARKRLGL